MPRKPTKERVAGQYFSLLVGTRNGVYYADGRGNTPDVGRHSLGTRDRAAALAALARLDRVQAVAAGRADRSALADEPADPVPLADGRARYLEYVGRPPVQRGASRKTVQRYRAVLDKFLVYAGPAGVRYWHQVTTEVILRYGFWLDERDYCGRTHYLELTVVRQVVNWLAGKGLIPRPTGRLGLGKPTGTDTYCYTEAQVKAMVAWCRADPNRAWLGQVIVALATTGLRIGELAGLRWADLDLARGKVVLGDDSRRARRSDRPAARTTKSHRGRAIDLHPDLRAVLGALPRRADGRVFGGPEGGRLKPDTVRRLLIRDVLTPLAAQFPATDADPGILAGRVHSFRHYFCSWAVTNDVPEAILSKWLGHRDSQMVRHYFHLQDDQGRRHMARLGSLTDPAAPPGRGTDEQPAPGGGPTG